MRQVRGSKASNARIKRVGLAADLAGRKYSRPWHSYVIHLPVAPYDALHIAGTPRWLRWSCSLLGHGVINQRDYVSFASSRVC
ncbi:hypothetical protein PR048_003476 [Dryococelus australis]|uniref:Uncharacterized protein n=1 Tax=Dryococelus australis TaxID=614101 RepID=A0ABQ9IP51_9NEOP|nr:hypothetical protein PR048_003476 [Dryococelus australis]